MISDRLWSVFRLLHATLTPHDIHWALTGSLAFAFQGLPVTPHDIDLQTDEVGAYMIEGLFVLAMTRPVRLSATDTIRSHFGALEIDGVKVEIMGDMQHRGDDGRWERPPDLEALIRFIDVVDMRVPVLALEHEYQAYLKMGRADRAAQLKALIQE